MTSSPVWLEVALNGAAGTALQPGIPITEQTIIEQALACVDAGAAIVHLHVYDDAGNPCEDVERYTRVIEGIRSQCDAIVYPTLALGGDIEQRYAPIRELARRGLLEWSVVDPGSVNITHRAMLAAGQNGIHYPNPDAHIKAGLELALTDGWRPAYAIYEPGFARLGAAMAALYPGLQTPIYRIMLSDNLLFGMRPLQSSLAFYAEHLALEAPGAPWMLSGLDAEVEHLIVPAIGLGAHIRVGLEDAPFGCRSSNLELVERAANQITGAWRRLATPAEIRG